MSKFAVVDKGGTVVNYLGDIPPAEDFDLQGNRLTFMQRIHEPRNTDPFFYTNGKSFMSYTVDWGREGYVVGALEIGSDNVKTVLKLHRIALRRMGFNVFHRLTVEQLLHRQNIKSALKRIKMLVSWVVKGS